MYLYKKFFAKKNQETDSIKADEITEAEKEAGGVMSLMKTKEERRRFALRQLLSFGTMVVVDIGLPLALYYGLKGVVGMVAALLISGIPPLLHVIIKFVLQRKVDALGCVIVFSYVLSAILSVISGDARLILLRDSTTTCVIATAFLITLIPIRTKWFKLRPVTYLFGVQMMSELPPLTWKNKDGEKQSQHIMEFLWEHSKNFRVQHYIQTISWGVCLMAEFIIKLIMIESTMSIDDIIWISNVIVIVVVVYNSVLSTTLSIVYKKRLNRCVRDWKKENDYSDMYKTSEEEEVDNNNKDSVKKINSSESGEQLV